MRKFLFFAVILAFTGLASKAQDTLLFQNFSTGIPNSWTLINGNNAVPDAGFNGIFTNAWIADNGSYFGMGTCAVSTSYFTPVGTADNWMITAPVIIPQGSTNVGLIWQAAAVDPNYPDGYTLYISTHGSDTITGFTTTLFSVAAENDYPDYGWTTHFVDLTAYAGDTISLAWVNNSDNEYVLGVTNISVITSIPNTAVTFNTLDAFNYMETGTAYQLQSTFTNNGFQAITSLTINHSVNGGAAVAGQLTGLNVAPGASTGFFDPNTFTPGTDTVNYITLWSTAINGTTIASADTVSHNSWSISNTVNKKVVMEEFTGTWCGFCPEGTVEIDTMMAHYNYFIPVAIHDSSEGTDSMVIAAGFTIDSAYSNGFPSAIVDRVYYLGQPAVPVSYTDNNWDFTWEPFIEERDTMGSPANVSLVNTTYDTTTRQLTTTVRADFLANVGGDYRLNLYVVEDSILGSGVGWEQNNYFSSTASGGSVDPNSPLYNLPDPITDWYHRHVLRAALGGAWGDAGIIPATVASGSSYTNTYTYTLPQHWNAAQVSIVGLVEEHTNSIKYNYILNAENMALPLPTTSAITPVSNDNFSNLMLYPNPTNNQLTIQFGLMQNSGVLAYVTDMMGQRIAEVYNGELNTGTHTISLNASNFAAGVYFVTLKTVNSEITQRFVVTK